MTSPSRTPRNLVAETIRRYLSQLAPHVRERESALLLTQGASEIERIKAELSQSRDNALEEAARVVELRAGVGPYAESMGAHRTLTSAADAIRSLKTKPALENSNG